MKNLCVNGIVEFLDEKPESINKKARVVSIYADGSVWLANLNMPFMGTISKVFSKEEFKSLNIKIVE